MLRITSKYKLGKRLGSALFEQLQTQKFTLSEARAKKPRGRAGSDYGRQLLEKQRVRFTYGITERQLSNYAEVAYADANPTAALHKALESRLDNAVYRAGFASTRRAARQMVSHGHITVNGTRSTIASHRIKKGDVIAPREGSRSRAIFGHLGNPEAEVRVAPTWIAFDRSLMRSEIVAEPPYAPGETVLDYSAVFEFYSR